MLMIFNIIYVLLVAVSVSYSEVRPCRLMVADTQEKQEKGLMGYRSLVNFDGMVFVYKEKAIRHFWNKNTYLELDLYWIDGERVVGRSYLPPVDRFGLVIVSSPQPVDKVVELVRGRKCMYGKILLSPELKGSKGKDAEQ